jgi:CHAT domain-containing protein
MMAASTYPKLGIVVCALSCSMALPPLTAQVSQERTERITERVRAECMLMEQDMDGAFKILLRHLSEADSEFARGEAELYLGSAYAYMGEFRWATRYYSAGLRRVNEPDYKTHNPLFVGQYPFLLYLADWRNKAAYSYGKLGDDLAAARLYQGNIQVLSEFANTTTSQIQEMSALRSLARSLYRLGQIQRREGNDEQAKATHTRMAQICESMLKLQHATGFAGTAGFATIYCRQSQARYELQQWDGALESIDACLEDVKRRYGDKVAKTPSVAIYRQLRGRILKALGRAEDALCEMEGVVEIAEANPTSAWLLRDAACELGAMYEQLGMPEKAESAYRSAVTAIEQVYTTLRMVSARHEFMESKATPYARLALLLARQRRWQEAFEVAESCRSRSLLDTLGNAPARESGAARIEPELLDEDREYAREISRLVRQLQSAQGDPRIDARATRRQLRDVRAEYALFRNNIALQHPGYAVFQTIQTVNLEDLRELFGRRPALRDTALIAYLIQDNAVVGFCFDGTNLHAAVLSEDANQVARQVACLRNAIAERDADWRRTAHALDDVLLKPFATHLTGKSRLLLLPHRQLCFAPLALLSDDAGKTLVERFAFGVIPSASLLRYWSRRDENEAVGVMKTGLAIANPDGSLPFAEREAKIVSDALQVTHVMIGAAAQEPSFFEQAPDVSVLHIATHGVLNSTRPEYSHLVLAEPDVGDAAQDGLLDVHEIVRKLDAASSRLVVLSACQSALGPASDGNEVQSLSNAFLYAGAREVIASLWSVDDESTSLLMREFYAQSKLGQTPMNALRHAMLKIARSGAHPYEWAGFQVIGDL